MGLPNLITGAAINGNGRTRPVDEELLASLVFLSQDYILRSTPPLVEITEPAVLIPIRVGRPIFFPEQLQGDAFALLALLLKRRKIWCGSVGWTATDRFGAVQRGFHLFFVPAVRKRPLDPGRVGTSEILVHGPETD